MKQHITVNQLQEVGLEPLPIGELGKLFRVDFVAQIKGMLMFNQSVRDVNDAIEEIASQITIGTMIESLRTHNAIGLGVIVDCFSKHISKEDEEYSDFELCDELWKEIKALVFSRLINLIRD